MKAKTAGDTTPEPESVYSPADIIAGAPQALGVAPEVAAGALSGITEPITISEARQRVSDWQNREVK